MTQRSRQIALSVLQSFQENSSYEDYQEHDGFTDDEYQTMLRELELLYIPLTLAEMRAAANPPPVIETTYDPASGSNSIPAGPVIQGTPKDQPNYFEEAWHRTTQGSAGEGVAGAAQQAEGSGQSQKPQSHPPTA